MQWPSRVVPVVLAAAALLVPSGRSVAVSEIRIDIGTIDGGTWRAEGVVVRLALSDAGPVAEVSASRMTLPAGLGSLERVTLTCPNPIVREPEFRCKGAHVTGRFGTLGAQSFTLDAGYLSNSETLDFAARELRVAGGNLVLSGRWDPKGWRAEARGSALGIAALAKLVEPFFKLPEGFAAEGRTAMHVRARGSKNVDRIDLSATLEELTANNAEGTLATDKLALKLEAVLEARGKDWAIASTVESALGQGYSEPIFIDFGAQPLKAQINGVWRADGELSLDGVRFDHQGIARGEASALLNLSIAPLLRDLSLRLDELTFPGAYVSLLQPFLLSTSLKDLETSGRVSGAVEMAAGAPASIDLRFDDVVAEDKAGKLAVQKLRGRLAWHSSEARKQLPAGQQTPESALQWDGARVFGLAGGPTSIRFAASGSDFAVLEPTMLPVFDGGLAVNHLEVRNFGTPDMELRFDAALRPISMRFVSEAFGWPTFGGKIEGRIPDVTLQERVLKFGGDLEAQIFGGRVVISQMQMRDPLGTYPRLSTNITLRNLDLEAVTGTFSFGTITGRLDGDIRDLELFRWQPIRFDARLATPRGDKSKHLISQRAVKNLSNIGGGGGGVAAALQGGLLRFFENFRYSRLGLSCRLENEICHMDGVEPATGTSYYIVKGSGLPRIDIIGNAHQVNWNRLVSQLKAIQESGGPVVD